MKSSTRVSTVRHIAAYLIACTMLMAMLLPWRSSAQSAEPTFLIFKYQHIVGKEIDRCTEEPAKRSCHSHLQLDFTGSSIALDADIQTDGTKRSILYQAKGANSTRSFIDLNVTVTGNEVKITESDITRRRSVPQRFFTLQQNVPIIVQELLFSYWFAQRQPATIPLLPPGEVHIRTRGTNEFLTQRLTRYTVRGVTWGTETVWLNEKKEIVAVVGGDAEEDRVEFVRPSYQSALKDFVKQAAADAIEDVNAAAKQILPIASGTYALTHATLIDPATDGPPARNVTVLVRDGKIAALGSGIPIPPHTRTFDLTGKFIVPGLWDTHAHFEQWEWGPAYLACGVTSVRDVGNEIEFLVPLRNSLNAGRGLGPRIYTAGLIDSDPGSLTSEHAEDAATARAIVRRYHDLGYEEIKIYQSLKPELIPIVAQEAHRLGMKVTGHVPTGTDAITAVRDGMDMINHISFVTRVMRPQGVTGVRADSSEAKAAIKLFLERQTIIEPTLARSEFNLHPERQPFSELEPSVIRLPPELAVILNNSGIERAREERAAVAFRTALETTKILYEAGVPILAGSDQVVPGASLLRELELLVRAGLKPIDAIRSATTVPAKVLNISDSGKIEVGKRADLVILDANPLIDIANIRRVRLTVLGGKVFDPKRLWRVVDIQPS